MQQTFSPSPPFSSSPSSSSSSSPPDASQFPPNTSSSSYTADSSSFPPPSPPPSSNFSSSSADLSDPKIEESLMKLHEEVDELTKFAYRKKNEINQLKEAGLPYQEPLKKAQREIAASVCELAEKLDGLSVQGYLQFYSQLKRMLYGRLDTLEVKSENLQRSETKLFEDDPTCVALREVEEKVGNLIQDITQTFVQHLPPPPAQNKEKNNKNNNNINNEDDAYINAIQSIAQNAEKCAFLRKKKLCWLDDINKISFDLDKLDTKNHPVKELPSRRRTLYAKLDLIETLILQRLGPILDTRDIDMNDDKGLRSSERSKWWMTEELSRLVSAHTAALRRGDSIEAAEIHNQKNRFLIENAKKNAQKLHEKSEQQKQQYRSEEADKNKIYTGENIPRNIPISNANIPQQNIRRDDRAPTTAGRGDGPLPPPPPYTPPPAVATPQQEIQKQKQVGGVRHIPIVMEESRQPPPSQSPFGGRNIPIVMEGQQQQQPSPPPTSPPPSAPPSGGGRNIPIVMGNEQTPLQPLSRPPQDMRKDDTRDYAGGGGGGGIGGRFPPSHMRQSTEDGDMSEDFYDAYENEEEVNRRNSAKQYSTQPSYDTTSTPTPEGRPSISTNTVPPQPPTPSTPSPPPPARPPPPSPAPEYSLPPETPPRSPRPFPFTGIPPPSTPPPPETRPSPSHLQFSRDAEEQERRPQEAYYHSHPHPHYHRGGGRDGRQQGRAEHRGGRGKGGRGGGRRRNRNRRISHDEGRRHPEASSHPYYSEDEYGEGESDEMEDGGYAHPPPPLFARYPREHRRDYTPDYPQYRGRGGGGGGRGGGGGGRGQEETYDKRYQKEKPHPGGVPPPHSGRRHQYPKEEAPMMNEDDIFDNLNELDMLKNRGFFPNTFSGFSSPPFLCSSTALPSTFSSNSPFFNTPLDMWVPQNAAWPNVWNFHPDFGDSRRM